MGTFTKAISNYWVSVQYSILAIDQISYFSSLLVGSIAIVIDSYAHGSFILTPLEFLKYNVLNEIGSFYGFHPWYWYLTTGIPTILGTITIPLLLAISETIRNRNLFPERLTLLASMVFTLVVYSLLPHKEFRFMLPILPMCLYISADYLSQWSRTIKRQFNLKLLLMF